MVIPADENARLLETDDAMMGSISHARNAQTSYWEAFHYKYHHSGKRLAEIMMYKKICTPHYSMIDISPSQSFEYR